MNSLTLSPTYSPPNSHSQVRQLTNKLDFLKAQLSAEQATANDMRGVSEMAEIKVRKFISLSVIVFSPAIELIMKIMYAIEKGFRIRNSILMCNF